MKTLTSVTVRSNTAVKDDVHELLFTKKQSESARVKQGHRDAEEQCEERRDSAKKKENINKLALEKYNNLRLFA